MLPRACTFAVDILGSVYQDAISEGDCLLYLAKYNRKQNKLHNTLDRTRSLSDRYYNVGAAMKSDSTVGTTTDQQTKKTKQLLDKKL